MASRENLIFILSDEFPYEQIIPPDSGPRYADNLDLEIAYVSQLAKLKDKSLIIDTKISKAECQSVKDFVTKNPDSEIILKLGDPYEVHQGHFSKMAFELTSRKNVRYISAYDYKAFTKEIYERVGPERITVIPYPYDERMVLEEPFEARLNKVILSGAKFKHFYPLRRRMMKKRFRNLSLPLQRYTDLLEHPGYPDIGDIKKHDFIGLEYIKLLTQYKFMLVTPSIYNIELLKYVECAYAGCVPVGEPAESLPELAKTLVLPITLKKNIGRQLRQIIKADLDYSKIARQYREQMVQARNIEVVRNKLLSFVGSA